MDLSIIIPFYRRTNDVRRLLSSLQRSIVACSVRPKVELILIIDSPENTLQELETVIQSVQGLIEVCNPFIIHNAQNRGVAAARNIGLEQATGNYIHLIDQDDEVLPSFYPMALHQLKQFDWVLLNGSFLFEKKSKQQKIYYLKPKLSLKNLVTDDFIRSPGQVVFKRNLNQGLGFISTKENFGADDRFFWIQLFALNPNLKVTYISMPLYLAYLHKDNFSMDSLQLYKCCLELWDKLPLKLLNINAHWVNRNQLALSFIVGNDTTFKARIEYLRYKFKFNRILRFLIKKIIRS